MRLELRIGETVQRKAAIPRQSRRVGPCRRHGTKQPLQRLSTQTIARLRNERQTVFGVFCAGPKGSFQNNVARSAAIRHEADAEKAQ